jgi:opacity protein-like surface antigen
MKTMLLAAVSAVVLTAAAAHAESEGAGDPFAFRAPGTTTVGLLSDADTGSASYLSLAGRRSKLVAAGNPVEVSATGSEGTVQTANSLPRDFAKGTAAGIQNRSVQRAHAGQAAWPAQAARAGLVRGDKPRG